MENLQQGRKCTLTRLLMASCFCWMSRGPSWNEQTPSWPTWAPWWVGTSGHAWTDEVGESNWSWCLSFTVRPQWNSRPNHQEEKNHKAHVKKQVGYDHAFLTFSLFYHLRWPVIFIFYLQHFKHAAPIPTEGVSPTAPTSYTASAAQETVNKSR